MISFIIPTLNEEKVLEATLAGLRSYSGECEIIVSDGGSKDRTVQIANLFADKVVVYRGEKRQTIAMGRNLGAAQAQGDLLLFLDADVRLQDINNFLSKAIQLFRERKLLGLTVEVKVLETEAKIMDKIVSWFVNHIFWLENNILHLGASPGEFQMIRKDAFQKLGGYDERLAAAEDVDMFNRLSKIGATYYSNSLTVFHTARRAHKVGWLKLIMVWLLNAFYLVVFRRSWSKVWEEVR